MTTIFNDLPIQGKNIDPIFKIFDYLSAKDLATAKLVSKFFNKIASDNCLWQNRLIDIKGKDFTKRSLPYPCNFIRLDLLLTRAFIKVSSDDFDARCAEINLSIHNLDTGVVKINIKDPEPGASNLMALRLSKDSKTLLENVSCFDQLWLETVQKVAKSLVLNFPYQMYSEGYSLELLRKIKQSYENPDERMKKLIKEYQITDLFAFKSKELIIHCKKGANLTNFMLYFEDKKKVYHTLLFTCYNSIVEKDFKHYPTYCSEIWTKLNDPSSGMREYLNEYITKEPNSLVTSFIKTVLIAETLVTDHTL